MELLAPAGGMEQLRAAIRFGADAVYLAADKFGMRARAANFSMEEIPEAVAIAHAAGVQVHVTCNVLMNPADTDELPAFFQAIDAAGVDALIISDLGAFALAREHAPHVALHVSTQASVANAAAARVWHSLGAKRIVCAREMSLADIARLRAETPPDLEIEAFVHGAMCMAVSGRCLISSYLTGRSGNKGHCTQPCRWSYTLEEEKRPGVHFPVEEDDRGTFIMNAKDMNMLVYLRELEAAGVTSIKIEGRNKKAFYVASVVNAYRRVLDGESAEAVAPELLAVSHRPYGTGFYFDEAEQAPDYDGYEQETMHVADVVSCEEIADAVPDAQGADAAGRVGGPLDVASPDAAISADGEDAEAVEGASGTSDGRDAETTRDISSASGEPGIRRFRLVTRCRNRYAEGDQLEVLAPRKAVVPVAVRDLTWLPEPTEDDPHPAPVPVAVANRSCALYSIAVDEPVEPGSFLRVRSFRRSARHDEKARTGDGGMFMRWLGREG